MLWLMKSGSPPFSVCLRRSGKTISARSEATVRSSKPVQSFLRFLARSLSSSFRFSSSRHCCHTPMAACHVWQRKRKTQSRT
ncbi:hypothetical protein H648_40377gpHYPp7 [Human mastadenovirus D]|uniref:Uncharacterized protein n=1 Tax=Human mastadenovirus D TaxID=130310 RepID=T1UJ27_9ADEN|nr:hypothetical protein H648_40377gpHYPp7 [Human mastadenovirus D]